MVLGHYNTYFQPSLNVTLFTGNSFVGAGLLTK